MFKAGLFFLSFLALSANSNDLPKYCYGQYEALMPAFQFEHNDKVHAASAYSLGIKLTPEQVFYKCGKLSFTGVYSNVNQEKNDISMMISISNNASIEFDFNISLNKKSKTLRIFGLKGMPDAELAKREIILKRK